VYKLSLFSSGEWRGVRENHDFEGWVSGIGRCSGVYAGKGWRLINVKGDLEG
jgi:hypothetical protein